MTPVMIAALSITGLAVIGYVINRFKRDDDGVAIMCLSMIITAWVLYMVAAYTQ